MAITFSDQLSPQAAILNMPTGVVLEKANILDDTQTALSGHIQGMMVAVRDAVENGEITADDAKEALGDFRGNIDFMSLAKGNLENAASQLNNLGIDKNRYKQGQERVREALAGSSSVNNNNQIQVPQMGQIHTALFADEIKGFKEINLGIMLSQRAIELASAGARIQRGEFDADTGAKRGFRVFDNDPIELQDAVQFAENLNAFESDLAAGIEAGMDYSETISEFTRQAFDNASILFSKAGQDGLAERAIVAKKSMAPWSNETPPAPAPEL